MKDPEPRVAPGARLGAGRSSESPDAPQGGSRYTSLVATGAFALLVAVTIPTYLARLDGYEFRGDDWRLFRRGGTPGDYLEPYNQHLTAVPIAVYRLLLEVFGLRATLPLRLVAVLSLAAAAVAMFLVVRARLGPPVALVVGAVMLWYPRQQLTPSAFNHWLALAAVIVCSWVLTRPARSADLPIALILTFALCTSGVGVAGAVGCVAYVVLTRPHLRRWLAVLVPSAAWGIWWLTHRPREVADEIAVFFPGPEHAAAESLADELDYALDGVMGTFRGLAAGQTAVGYLLLVLFVAVLVLRLRSGPRAAAVELSWTAAFVFWWVGLAHFRGAGAGGPSRYQLVGSAFLILALLSERRAEALRARLARPEVGAAALVLTGLVLIANHGDIFGHARHIEAGGRAVRQQLVAANLGPEVVPDEAVIDVGARLNPSARVYRDLTADHGVPGATRTDDPDGRIVALGPIRPRAEPGRPEATCLPLGAESTLPAAAEVLLRAGDHKVEVEVRRFGEEWAPMGSIAAGATARLELPGLNSPLPWRLRARGACRVQEGPAVSLKVTGTRLAGKVTLGATVVDWYVTEIEFRLQGDDGDERVLGRGVRFIGDSWLLEWDSTSVPDGEYTVTAVGFGPDGFEDRSKGLHVTVTNG